MKFLIAIIIILIINQISHKIHINWDSCNDKISIFDEQSHRLNPGSNNIDLPFKKQTNLSTMMDLKDTTMTFGMKFGNLPLFKKTWDSQKHIAFFLPMKLGYLSFSGAEKNLENVWSLNIRANITGVNYTPGLLDVTIEIKNQDGFITNCFSLNLENAN